MIETKTEAKKDLSSAKDLIAQLPQNLAKIWDPAESGLRETCLKIFIELEKTDPAVIYDSGENNFITVFKALIFLLENASALGETFGKVADRDTVLFLLRSAITLLAGLVQYSISNPVLKGKVYDSAISTMMPWLGAMVGNSTSAIDDIKIAAIFIAIIKFFADLKPSMAEGQVAKAASYLSRLRAKVFPRIYVIFGEKDNDAGRQLVDAMDIVLPKFDIAPLTIITGGNHAEEAVIRKSFARKTIASPGEQTKLAEIPETEFVPISHTRDWVFAGIEIFLGLAVIALAAVLFLTPAIPALASAVVILAQFATLPTGIMYILSAITLVAGLAIAGIGGSGVFSLITAARKSQLSADLETPPISPSLDRFSSTPKEEVKTAAANLSKPQAPSPPQEEQKIAQSSPHS